MRAQADYEPRPRSQADEATQTFGDGSITASPNKRRTPLWTTRSAQQTVGMSRSKHLVATGVAVAVVVLAAVLLFFVGPSSKQVKDWVATWGPLLTLVASVLLLAVTALYAYLTKSMADSARDAALSSKIAAEASQASAAASEAAVEVAFQLEPSFGSTVGELEKAVARAESEGLKANDSVEGVLSSVLRWNEIEVRTTGATVYLRGCVINEVTWSESSEPESNVVKSKIVTATVDLEPTVQLPRRQHRGESISFRAPEDLPFDETPSAIKAVVNYSLGGAGDTHGRQVTWDKPRGLE